MGKVDKQRRGPAARQGGGQEAPGNEPGRRERATAAVQEARAVPAGDARPRPQVKVGAEVNVTCEYKDMEALPEDEGLAHCGYLVLQRGERLRVMYVGSTATGDMGWLYGEVLLSLRRDPVGRRGWLPEAIVEPLGAAPPPAPSPPTTSSGGRGAAGAAAVSRVAAGAARTAEGSTAVLRGGGRAAPEPPPPPPPADSQKSRAPAAGRGTPAPSTQARPPGAGTKSGRVMPHSEAFPPLLTERAGQWGGHARFEQEAAGTGAESKADGPAPGRSPESPTQREAAAAAIARQRAAAAKAAAAAVAGSKAGGERSCPICMEPFTTAGRRRTQRPCCGVELCVQCDHKSLRSKRCYFCREDGDDFPSLVLACRVSA